MFGFKFLGNTHIPHHKNTAGMKPVKMTPPKEVLIPTSQNIGAPATPIVKQGDEVKVGQIIAEAAGYVSAPIYASVSGKVAKIEKYTLSGGNDVPAIRIESDGLMTVSENITPPDVHDLDTLIEAVKNAGIVGLGGAGFPTYVKLEGYKKGGIDTVVVNGAECEPYITSDTRTMLDRIDDVKYGIDLLEKYMPNVERFIFGIEDNKPECVDLMKNAFSGNAKVSIAPLPSLYPQGAEKVLIYNTTKKIVPEGKLPQDVGVMVINVTTLANIADYVKTGMPLVEKCITVDGSAVKDPKNVIVPIGASIGDVLSFVGVDADNVGKVLFGGPMMGVPAYSMSNAVEKRTNALTAFTPKDAEERESTECIHCGKCVEACPMNLNPSLFSKAVKLGTDEKMEKLDQNGVALCMECGCCSYVCPAKRPLVQNNRMLKSALREYKAHKSTLK